MSPQLRSRLSLESLEARDNPNATVSLAAGTLTIRGDNTANDVSIQETTPGLFAVTVNGTPRGSHLARNVLVTMGGGNDTVDLAVNTTLPGLVAINLGGGNDSFTTKNSTLNAKIGGSVTINTGPSKPIIGGFDEVVELYNLNFTGAGVQVNGSAGSGTEQLDMQSMRVAGTLTARNMYVVYLGLPGDTAGAVTINTLVVDNTFHNTDTRTDSDNGGGNALFMFSGSKVSRNMTYYGGAGRDDVDLPTDFPAPVADVFIGGNLTVYGRNGINTLALGYNGFGAHVGGNLTFAGGSGTDRFFFDNGSTVGGNVNLTLMAGADQVFGDSTFLGAGPYDPVGTATIGGSLILNLGEGNNFIGTYGPGASLFTGGDVKFIIGNGNTTGGSSGAPGAITFFNNNVTIGGQANYLAGRGSQVLEISNANIADLVIKFGGGADTVNFTTPVFNGNLILDFGFGTAPKGFETDPMPTTFMGRTMVQNSTP